MSVGGKNVGGTRTKGAKIGDKWRPKKSGSGAAFGAVIGAIVLVAGWMVAGSVPRPEVEPRLGDGAAWLTSTAFGGISLHDGGDGAAMTNLQVAEDGANFTVAQDGPNALVVNNSTGEVARVNAATWSITRRVSLAEPDEGIDLIVGRGGAWVAREGSVAPIDPTTLDLRSALPVSDRLASAVVTTDGDLVFSGQDANSDVMLFAQGEEPQAISGLDGPVAFASLIDGVAGLDQDSGAVWLEGSGVVCEGLPVPSGTPLIGAGSGTKFVAAADTGSVFVFDPAAGCPATEEFLSIEPGRFGTPVVADDWAVIPDLSSGEVVVIALDDVSVVSRRTVLEPGVEFDLVGEDDSIWFNDPTSSTAGLLKPNGDVIEIEKYTDEGDGGFSVAPTENSTADLEVAGLDGNRSGEPDDAPEPQIGESDDPGPEEANQDDSEDGSLEEPDLEPAAATEQPSNVLPEPNLGPDVSEDSSNTEPDQSVAEEQPGDENEGLAPAGPTVENESEEDENTDEPAGDAIAVAIQQSKVTAEVGDSVLFRAVVSSGDPASFQWSVSPDPGGSGSTSGLEITRTFADSGTYTIQLTACDQNGTSCDSATRSLQVVDNEDAIPVTVSLSGPAEAVVGQSVELRAIVEGDPDTITWTIEDGSPASASGTSATTSFNSVGTKTVRVTAERGEERRTETMTITVVEEAQPADLVIRCAPSTLAAGESTQCGIDGYSSAIFSDVSWSFSAPDRSLGSLNPSGGSATFTYDGGGSVTVTAQATDVATGSAVTDSAALTFEAIVAQVEPAPTIAGRTDAEIDQSVSFSVSIAGGTATSISWSADGTSATGSGENFSASWSTAGTYTVRVEATGPGGTGVDTHTIVIEADEGPVVDPGCNESAALQQPTVVATDSGGGRVDVTVTANKCVTADMNWEGGRNGGDGVSRLSHSFVITGLSTGVTYGFSTTVNDGTTRRFGSDEVTIGGTTSTSSPDAPTQIIISGLSATPTSSTSVSIRATTNICAWSDWSGTAVSRNGPRPDCFTSHNHMNPDWGGSLPLSPGGTYTVTLTAHDPAGVLPSVSSTISFTMPADTTTTTTETTTTTSDDPDGDGVFTSAGDNCPDVANGDQADNDGDGLGNVCDPTPDGDPNPPTTPTTDPPPTDPPPTDPPPTDPPPTDPPPTDPPPTDPPASDPPPDE